MKGKPKMNNEDQCESELHAAKRIAWEKETANARDELLTRQEISWKYNIPCEDFEEIRKTPQFPKHYLTQTGGWMYPKKEIEAFLKEHKGKNLMKGSNNE
jgi:hypothetical protein